MGLALPEDRHITYQLQYRKCGKGQRCSTCREGRGHGPYWYAYWRDRGGRLHSSYVGKEMPAAAAYVARATAAAAKEA